MIIELVVIIICLVLSAFFSASETAYNVSNESRLEKNAEGGKFLDKLTLKISKNYNFALTSILVGNNLVNFIISSVATSMAIKILFDAFKTGESIAAAVATAVTTIVVLIFGELCPKTLASSRGEGLARVFSVPLCFFMIIFSPVAFILNGLIKFFSLLLKNNETPSVTPDELASIIETGESEGSIDEERSELLQSAIDFNETTVKEIMIPRVDMIAIDIEDSIDEILKAVFENPYSRIPVYEGSIDNIIGIIVVQQLFKALTHTKKEEIDLREMLVEPYFIHMTVKLPDALDVLREERTHIMIVLDEFGGTMGIVTMEDILEELVGDIWDEDEETESEISHLGDNTYIVEGDMNIFDFFEAIEFDEGDFESEHTTVGGWAIEMLEGFPEEGASFEYENLVVTIGTIDEHRITKLTVVVNPVVEQDDN